MRVRVLTPEKVTHARQRVAAGASLRSLAREMNVTRQTLAAAVHGRTWKHIQDPPPIPSKEKPKTKPRICRHCRQQYRTRDGNCSSRYCPICWYSYHTAKRLKARRQRATTLTMGEVRQIRHLRHDEGWGYDRIAAHVGRPTMTVYNVANWKTWRDAGGPGRPADLKPTGRCRRCEVLLYSRYKLCPDCQEVG